MQSFIDHARSLGDRIAGRHEERERFGRLAEGQSPMALFYAVDTGLVLAYEPELDVFLPL